MINGHVHKTGVKEYVIPMQDTTDLLSFSTCVWLLPDWILKRMFCYMELGLTPHTSDNIEILSRPDISVFLLAF